MPTFKYRAVNTAGELVEGEMEAREPALIIERLRELGHMPLRTEVASGGASSWLGRDLLNGRAVSRKRIVLMTRELATLLGAGLPLDRALELLIELSKHQASRELLVRISNEVRGGAALGEAMAAQSGAFTPLYVNLVRAGEAGGALEAVLARLAEHLEKAQTLADTVRSALIYPAVLVAMTALSVFVLMTVVIPQFQPVFEDAGDALPLATQIIINLSDFLARFWWIIATAIIAGVWLLRWRLTDPSFRYYRDSMLLRLPLFGDLTRKVEVTRFSRTLGTLVQNGMTLLNALPIVRDTMGNSVLVRAVDLVSVRLREGKGLAQPLAETGAFPDLSVHLVRVGEETGELDAMLTRVAEIYDREVQTAIERLISLLVPALTIGLGVIIATIIGSVLLAFMSVNELAL